MMAALSEQVAYVFRIHLVQQVVENYETRSTVAVAKILGHALVETDVLTYSDQFLSRDGRHLAVTQDDPAAKIRFRTERIEMLQKTQVKR